MPLVIRQRVFTNGFINLDVNQIVKPESFAKTLNNAFPFFLIFVISKLLSFANDSG